MGEPNRQSLDPWQKARRLPLTRVTRQRVEEAIERLIALLDACDGDSELEDGDIDDDLVDLEDDDPSGDPCDYGVPSYG